MGGQKAKPVAVKETPVRETPPEPQNRTKAETEPSDAEVFFSRFASTLHSDESRTAIEPDGLQRLCAQIGVDPGTDVAVLVLAWKCRTRTMGIITKEEFMQGMQELQIGSVAEMKRKIEEMRALVRDPSTVSYRDFYRFVFEMSREPGSKVLDIDTSLALLDLLLVKSFPLAGKFKTFLSTKDSLRALSVDQWMSFLEFCKQHSRSLSNYDSDGACKRHTGPVLVDEFVGWLQAGN